MTKYTRLVEKLKAAGWHQHYGDIWSEPDFRTSQNYKDIRQQIRQEGRLALALEVIEALGLENSYPDIERTRKVWDYTGHSGMRQLDQPYIVSGSVQFLKDIEAVRLSRKAKSARKRLFRRD